ncbi:L-threonine 3-dehydrogenase [Allofrancisella guangzhouensis]|uniref:L-threonine 3-dehydrogenase n=1 Tax=Allofrancisella guangzhouensis TaxID=594679 RepID=A0A0A8E444_9GAMM|nr:L-threonine 3-dehydrogenase [Allofrancisella guangzhouensis]AJC48773.1 L-threonine 3-dehydrogenase [Allofrancisella guangzhouensis]MBK2027339.1 L-threonine 3-dehydrogenase [Allofrancisella guangzhouensis]MBK2044773.1 L-threonine 3-dehydrogenase [Allofrancisella guangzhouensis]MBK2045245.1 L-threonine 3-dehydrogenase [Allofrancisella guangzhouensis]
MKALTKLKKEPGIWMVNDAPIPEYGHNDILIKIRKTAICGTDLHIYNWDKWSQETIPTPMIIGHEFVGEVAAKGDEVKGFNIGDRVSGEGHLVCGLCRNCKAGKRHLCRSTIGIGVNVQGAFAEYLVMPASNVFKVPDTISDDIASIFDPLGNAVHTALSFNLTGEDILITGAGPIGLMAVKIARFCGARRIVVTDINEYRLKKAKDLGATFVFNAGAFKSQDELTKGMKDIMSGIGMTEGFDIGLEMSGINSAISMMLNVMNHGGKMSLLGISAGDITLDWAAVLFKSLILKGIYGREMFETWYLMSSMIQSGLDISPVITHRFDIDDYQKAFDTMKSGKCGKVVLDWSKK